MEYLPHSLLLPLEWFARGGGGGSGGGSGGGGDGIIILLGYLPMHFVGAKMRKRFVKTESLTLPLNIVGWIICITYAVILITAWGGIGFWIALGALVGMPAGLYGWFGKLRQSKLVKKGLQSAAANDTAWDEQKLIDYSEAIFKRYQQDWSNLDADAMKAYMTPQYQHHAALLLYTLQLLGRKNSMQDVQIVESSIINMNDAVDNTHDTFTIGFTARARDQLIDNTTQETLFTDNNTFTEFWRFVRNGDTWLLDGINQATANVGSDNATMRDFAVQNGYYYSQDMGWLFIPKRGMLFNGAKFGNSDINNHIVGLYNQQLLVQIYSYIKTTTNNNASKPYVIAQVNVPKQYGNIIVRRNKLVQMPIMGLQRVRTEWTQFNKKYEVFASAPEQATSFELLNPTYMEQLEALPFEVNIEVVDNVIYLYTNERGSDATTYQTMLDLVNKAFKEMRL